jgi:hypothetical protein
MRERACQSALIASPSIVSWRVITHFCLMRIVSRTWEMLDRKCIRLLKAVDERILERA